MSSSEPWDEIMGPPPDLDHDRSNRPILTRGNSAPAVPPSSAFSSTLSSARTSFRASPTSSYTTAHHDPPRGSPTSYKASINDRWAKYELDDDLMQKEAEAASFKAITMAAERAFQEKVSSGEGIDVGGPRTSPRSSPRASPTSGMPGSAAKKWTDRLSRYTIGSYDDDDILDPTVALKDESEALRRDSEAIRAEALEMLKKADGKIKAPYAIQKTQSGGYSASLESPHDFRRTTSGGVAGQNKRVPSALSGLNLTAPLKTLSPTSSKSPSPLPSVDYSDNTPVKNRSALEISRQYDTPHVVSSTTSSVTKDSLQENFDDLMKEEEDLINVVETSKPGSKWSSRYSVDQTLKALTGGGKSPKDVLDQFDRENMSMTESERQITGVVRDLFWGGAHHEHEEDHSIRSDGKIFGAGFSFRQKHVFGKQGGTGSPNGSNSSADTNLHTICVDLDDSKCGSLPPPEPRKTWQEQMKLKKKQRRQITLLMVAAILVVATIVGTVTGIRRVRSSDHSLFVGDAVTFYVTSNTPFDASEEVKLHQDLSDLASLNGEFLVHLGNIQDSDVTLCSSSRYPSVRDILLGSPVPVLVTPGEEDWNNCPNPDRAWRLWVNNFGLFESNFQHQFRINRQQRRPENFGFVHKNVLFVGFHLVNGRIDDVDEWNTRHEDNIAWMESMVTITHDQFRAIVMFGNARPSPQQRQFFTRLQSYLGTDTSIPVIYIHANSGVGGVVQYQMFDGAENIKALQTDNGGRHAPLRVSVGHGEDPFVIG